jgi:hypothetical protein
MKLPCILGSPGGLPTTHLAGAPAPPSAHLADAHGPAAPLPACDPAPCLGPWRARVRGPARRGPPPPRAAASPTGRCTWAVLVPPPLPGGPTRTHLLRLARCPSSLLPLTSPSAPSLLPIAQPLGAVPALWSRPRHLRPRGELVPLSLLLPPPCSLWRPARRVLPRAPLLARLARRAACATRPRARGARRGHGAARPGAARDGLAPPARPLPRLCMAQQLPQHGPAPARRDPMPAACSSGMARGLLAWRDPPQRAVPLAWPRPARSVLARLTVLQAWMFVFPRDVPPAWLPVQPCVACLGATCPGVAPSVTVRRVRRTARTW